MNEPHQSLDRFSRAARGLEVAAGQINPADPDPDAISIALAQAKRVRRESNLLVRTLARIRDNLHSQEADNKS